MDRNEKRAVLIGLSSVLFAAAVVLIPTLMIRTLFEGDRKEVYESPGGTNEITVRYDFVSRPYIIYKGEKIWEYQGSGYNEEVFWDVIWESEDTFSFKYDDPTHDGMYAEEYEITLP